MPITASPERTTLYFRQGSSDKVYRAAIEPSGPGFVVTFAFGRRGSTLQSGAKTTEPVGYDEARKIYDRLVKEKTAKGYTPGEDGTPYQQTEKAERATDVTPQLCNPLEECDVDDLLADPAWWAQEKLDGRRMLIRRVGDEVTGINRQGLVVALPQPVARLAVNLGSQQWLMDGEAVGDVFIAFDLLESACVDLRPQPYSQRLKALGEIVSANSMGTIRLIETATNAAAKKAMLAALRKANREGLVFKQKDAPHTPGRPASGGSWRKLKFTATCSCLVAGANGSRRSVRLELLDREFRRVGVGSVTVPLNQSMPAAGQVVEVRYLYAYRGGSLYQPVFIGVRHDIPTADCTLTQLKFKSEDEPGDG